MQQLAELRDYLVRVARESDNEIVATINAEAPRIIRDAAKSAGSGSGSGAGSTAGDAMDHMARLRALIVKTAEDSRERPLQSKRALGEDIREQVLAIRRKQQNQ